MQQRAVRYLTALFLAAAAVGGLWLALRFLLPWLAPFLLALALATLLEPLVRALVRRGCPRAAAAGLATLSLLAATVWGVFALAGRGIAAVTAFARQAPELMQGMAQGFDRLEQRLLAAIDAAPEGVSDYLLMAMNAVGDALYALPGLASQWALDALGRTAQSSGEVLLFTVTAAIGTYFFSASYPRSLAFLRAQIPPELGRRLTGLDQDLKSSVGALLRAQLILMGMTFFQLLLGFLLLKVPGALGLAALTALVDALPVFGTGAVLLPWALCAFLLDESGRALGLLICWGVVNLVRNCAQPKLLGDQIGLDPIASLLAIYVGWKLAGLWGMLLFPLLLVTAQQLNDKGLIKLWKTP